MNQAIKKYLNLYRIKYETAREILRSMKREYGAENSLVKKGRFTLRMAGMDLDDLH